MKNKYKTLLILSIMIVIFIGGQTSAKANESSAFSYDVGARFYVDGFEFKIVNKELRQAVSIKQIMKVQHHAAQTYAGNFSKTRSYIISSYLPTEQDYNNPVFREGLVFNLYNLEWTAHNYLCTSSTGGFGFYYDDDYFHGVRLTIYLKPDLYISNGILLEQLDDPIIQIQSITETSITVRDIQEYKEAVERQFIMNGESTPWIGNSEYIFTLLNPNVQQQITIKVRRVGG